MPSKWPEVQHVYQNHTIDSTRWQPYQPRDNDIVIATSYKSGTTWMQNIVHQLLFLGQTAPSLWDVAFWLDARFNPNLEEVIAALEGQSHRRSIKTHLALDGLPFYPQVKYIVVGRDARDVFMSWWNHYSNFTDGYYERMQDSPGRVGPPLPRCSDNIHGYWQQWITQGWFAWENEGYPMWGNMHHTQTWWHYRHLENILNILFVHYSDLLADLAGEISHVAAFLDIEVTAENVTDVAQLVSFTNLKQQATGRSRCGHRYLERGHGDIFSQGNQRPLAGCALR